MSLNRIKPQYTLAGDLFVLAAKSLNSGNVKDASKLFAHACKAEDIQTFIDYTLATSGVTASNCVSTAKASLRVIAALEQNLVSEGPIEESDLRRMLAQIKQHHASHACDCLDSQDEDCMCHASSGCDLDENYDEEEELASMDEGSDEDEQSLDVEDEEQLEEESPACTDCDCDPCECDHESEGTMEEELSSAMSRLDESLKNSLVTLKMRSKEWEVKNKYVPILISFFPQAVSGYDDPTDMPVGALVNRVLNLLKGIDIKAQVKLDKALKPLQG
jgi:hypothetical protein